MARRVAILLVVLAAGCASGRLSSRGDDAERVARWRGYWELYRRNDPAWGRAREAWWSEGAEARESLVLNLVGDLVRKAPDPSRVGPGSVPVWKRPLDEIVELARRDPGTVFPLLEEALRAAKEPLAASAVATALVEAGGGAVLMRITKERRPDDAAIGVGAAFQGLVEVGGREAIEAVGGRLEAEEDWRLRARAAAALGRARLSDRERAATALLPGLADSDPFVVERTLSALAGLGSPRAAPAVADLLERALARGDARIAGAAVAALERLTGARGPADDPVFWRRVAEEAAGGG